MRDEREAAPVLAHARGVLDHSVAEAVRRDAAVQLRDN